MTTYYTDVQTLEMRVRDSTLIVTGTVGSAVDRQVDYYDHEPFIRTTYEVTIEEVLKGTVEQRDIRVEVLGSEATAGETPLREGASLVLLLVPQAGAAATDAFVPYFRSAFPLDPDGQIILESQAAAELSSPAVPIKGERISLNELRGLIRTVTEADAADTSVAEAAMAGQSLPPVLEMPQGFAGGGEASAPEVAEPPASAS